MFESTLPKKLFAVFMIFLQVGLKSGPNNWHIDCGPIDGSHNASCHKLLFIVIMIDTYS